MLCSLSHLDGQAVKQIQTLESELNQTLLAFSCHDINPTILDADKLTRIQDLEKKLGISLVAIHKA